MYEHITVTVDKDDLNREEFAFWVEGSTLWLDRYAVLTRPTTRHKFQVTKHYYRLDSRMSDLAESEVPLTDEIRAEAMRKFADSMRVKVWSERGR